MISMSINHIAVLDVIEVIFEFDAGFFNRGGITVIDLCPTGDTRLDQQARPVEGDFLLEFGNQLGTFGTRSHQAHFAAQDIPELRQFVYVGAAQEIAKCVIRLIFLLRDLNLAILFGILVHCAEFIYQIIACRLCRNESACI